MKKIVSLLLVLLLISVSLTPLIANAKGEEKTVNRFNVVLVIDASLSMKESDAKNNRFEATDLFLGMLANDGNYVGAVSFNGNIYPSDLIEVNGISSKKKISNSIRTAKLENDTNIGGALLKATDLIEANGKKDLPSIIILLSDGKTDFAGAKDEAKKLQVSKEQKENALEIARDKGYTICAVSLNNDSAANNTELKNIAKATEGGMFEEVNNSSDLKNVFDKFYTKIYGTKSTKLADDKIGKNGSISKKFTITDAGVEEVNIAIFGSINSCSVTNPDGSKISDKELEKIVFSAKSFKIIKLVNPKKGDWNVTVNGKPGAKITVVKTYNVNLNVKNTILNESKSYKANNAIDIQTELYENNVAFSDISQYSTFKAKMVVKDFDGNVIYEKENNEANADGFKFSFTPDKIGTYYANVYVEGNEVFADSEEMVLNVGNTEPTAISDTIKKHINVWPFLIKTDSTIDLSGAAKDNEDSTLTYKVDSATWEKEDYSLDGNKLTINSFKNVSKGSFKIQAIDSQGAYCTFDVKVTSTNIGILTMLLLIILIMLILLFSCILAYKNAVAAFLGEITVTNLDTYRSDKSEKRRGKLKLKMIDIGNTGFSDKSYFQATGKNYIYFKSRKPFWTDAFSNKIKKIKINSNTEVRIYSNPEKTLGIEVKFSSYRDNQIF